MQEEYKAERSQFRGVPLCLPKDQLEPALEGFKCSKKLIPEVGFARLWCFNRILTPYSTIPGNNHLGVAVIDNSLIVQKVEKFRRKNLDLYDLWVVLSGPPSTLNVQKSTNCTVSIPYGNNKNIFLENGTNVGSGFNPRYSFSAKDKEWQSYMYWWKSAKPGNHVHLLVPKDPEFLSTLRFSFWSVSKINP